MMKNELEKLSKTIVNYSLEVKEKDRVLITLGSSECRPLVQSLIREIVAVGGLPFIKVKDIILDNDLLALTTKERIQELRNQGEYEVEHYDCFINIRYTENDYEGKNIPHEVIQELGKAMKKVDHIRINKRRWVLLNYPSVVDAFKAHMKIDEFYSYAMKVMTTDYEEMCELSKSLKARMEKTDKVRIVGPNTDITFSIKGMPAIPCCGKSNIPDGEVYTAPIKESVNGRITYNTPCPYQGNVYTGVSLVFQNGKIMEATCNENDKLLNKIFDTDPGARYIGEFSLGFHPEILEPMGDILYDEKILGSLHFTPGRCYEDCDNGNTSAVHWDMVLIQRKEHGGGEIYFDDELIRKDGIFLPEDLKPLNYHLK